MTSPAVDEFLQGVRPAVISTLSAGGSVHSVLVWYMWDGTSFTVLTDRGSVKHRNVIRTAAATICIHDEYAYVSVTGDVAVHDPVPIDERIALWTRYDGEEVARQVVTPETTARLVGLVLNPRRWLSVGIA